MNELTKTEFRIPDANLEPLRARLEKLSKKAMKLCGEPIVLTVVNTVDTEKMRPLRRNPEAVGGWDMEGTGEFERHHVVTVTGPVPRINGWRFVAAVDVVEADGEKMTLLRCAPGETVPAEFRTRTEGCDHCQTARNRKSLYVLRREAP